MDCGDLLFLALDELEHQEGELESSSYWEDESGPEALAVATTDPDLAKELWKFVEKHMKTNNG
jgi:hypothetical protein